MTGDVKKKTGLKEKVVLYVGTDKGYAKTLSDRLKSHFSYITDLVLNYYSKFDTVKFEKIVVDIHDISPVIIYVDLSSNSKEFFELINYVKRDHKFANIPVVALVEKKELLKKSLLYKIDFVHIKCGEIHDVLYDPMFMAFPKLVKRPDFAMAKFKNEAKASIHMMVGYATANYIHVETDALLTVDEEISLDLKIPSSILPSRGFSVSKKYNTDLIYDFKYAYDLRYHYVDYPEFTQEEEEDPQFEKIKEHKIKEFENLVLYHKKKVKDWVNDAILFSRQKSSKIVVFDPVLNVFRATEESSRGHKFSMRVQTSLEGTLIEIDRIRPHIIAFNFQNEGEEMKNQEGKEQIITVKKADDDLNDIEKLTAVIKKVKSSEGAPYIITFNSDKFSSKTLQETYRYPNMLANPDKISYKFLNQLGLMIAEKREKKLNEAIAKKVKELRIADPKKYRNLREGDLVEHKYYIDKHKEVALAYTKRDIILFEMTESLVSFCAQDDFEVGNRISIDFPLSMEVTVVPPGDARKPNGVPSSSKMYRGLIHGLNEIEKQDLRKFVNKIFFSDLEESRAKEKEDLERIKQDVLKKKTNKDTPDEEEE